MDSADTAGTSANRAVAQPSSVASTGPTQTYDIRVYDDLLNDVRASRDEKVEPIL